MLLVAAEEEEEYVMDSFFHSFKKDSFSYHSKKGLLLFFLAVRGIARCYRIIHTHTILDQPPDRKKPGIKSFRLQIDRRQ